MLQKHALPVHRPGCFTPQYGCYGFSKPLGCCSTAKSHCSTLQRSPVLLYATTGDDALQAEDAFVYLETAQPAIVAEPCISEAATEAAHNSSTGDVACSRRRPTRAAASPYTVNNSSGSGTRVQQRPARMPASSWAAAASDISDTSRRRKDVHQVPGASQSGSAEVQLVRQFRDLMRNPMPGVCVAPDDNDLLLWHVKLCGPDNSPYAGGWFDVKLRFSMGFPGDQPSAMFSTRIWHPNISESGRVCISLGSGYAGSAGVRSVACVLAGLQMLLATPNPHSPLNMTAAMQMLKDPEEFRNQARQWTQQHAM